MSPLAAQAGGKDGTIVTVEKAEALPEKVTVHNLVLDGADGFVADGLRVLSFPDMGSKK